MSLKILDIILYKHPSAKFVYHGDGVQVKPHTMPNGDEARGLIWHDDSISKPTAATIEKWRADAESGTLWAGVREKRDELLRDSDWTTGNDSPLNEAKQSAWASYRQSLRDVPQNNANDPSSITWPNLPE